ncbi:MAG: SGNH/GDSL hydrolase family protein [Lachnospiraceae bacterium]
MSSSKIRWCAIGDSFTYLNDHLDETGYRVRRGYLSGILEKCPELSLQNIGINGSTYTDWVNQEIPEADLYTVLLGTNDWHQGTRLGTQEDFNSRAKDTILGCMAVLLDHIRAAAAPGARIIVANPTERGDFVYQFDYLNNAQGSYAPWEGQKLSDVADAILRMAEKEGLETVDLNRRSGFTPENSVRFKRLRVNGEYRNLPYPDYIGVPFDPEKDEYPYPPEAVQMTYDGLHPSQKGNDILAGLFAGQIRSRL